MINYYDLILEIGLECISMRDKTVGKVSEMARGVKKISYCLSLGFSSVPGAHMKEDGENRLHKAVL